MPDVCFLPSQDDRLLTGDTRTVCEIAVPLGKHKQAAIAAGLPKIDKEIPTFCVEIKVTKSAMFGQCKALSRDMNVIKRPRLRVDLQYVTCYIKGNALMY